MKSRERKRKKGEAFLIRVAESIGSTMGTIVGRANAAQKAMTQSPVARTVKREGKKLVGKSKKAKTIMPADLKADRSSSPILYNCPAHVPNQKLA